MKKKILAILLALTVVFSFIACGKPADGSENGAESRGESLGESKEESFEVTDDFIVKNGASDYVVLYPADQTSLERLAVSEFVNFFKEATNITLRTLSDDRMEAGGKYISVGYTKLLEQAGYTYSAEELKIDGFKIKTRGDDMLIFGANDYGTIYGVYEALKYLLDFEYFYSGSYRLEKGVTNLPLLNLDVVEIPDIEYRATGYGSLSNNSLDCYRLRMRPYPEFFIPVNGLVFHNSIRWVESSPNFKASWISTTGDQLCYTAGGDEDEVELMLNASMETLKSHLAKYPNTNVITYTIEDNPNFCRCDGCKEIIDEYNGTNSSVVILYLNKLNEKVKAWFESAEGRPYKRDLDIVFFAYNATTEAPVVYNEQTKKYEGINGLKLNDGISVMYAPISVDFTSPMTEGINAQFYKTAKQWSDISQNVYYWIYSTNFSFYLAPYDSFDGIVDNYRVAKEINTRWIFDQAQWNEYGFSTGWSNLKSYINAKLAWDTDLDINVLIDDFFETYFGPAQGEMREIFNQMRMLTAYNKKNNKLGGLRSIYQNVLQEKFWPKMILADWINLCEQALARIEPLKESNPILHRNYYKHIVGERISIYYLFISLYYYNTDDGVIAEYQQQFKLDTDAVGITLTAEGNGTIASLIKGWSN